MGALYDSVAAGLLTYDIKINMCGHGVRSGLNYFVDFTSLEKIEQNAILVVLSKLDMYSVYDLDGNQNEEHYEQWVEGEKTDWAVISNGDQFNPHWKCRKCNEDIPISFNGESIMIGDQITPCPHSYSERRKEVTIPVPSGKLVFGNDFRRLVNNVDETTEDNIVLMQNYAKEGMMFVYVGNTCPGIYQGDGRAIIANYNDESTFRFDIDMKRKGSICTDLWWVCAMDYEAYLNAGGVDSEIEAEIDIHGNSATINYNTAYNVTDSHEWVYAEITPS